MKKNFLETLSFWVQGTWFNLVLIGSFLAFIGVILFIIDTRLVSENREAPEFAPFADPLDRNLSAAERTMPLNEANRSYTDLEAWVNIAISEALSFDAIDYYSTLAEMRKNYFTKEAYEQYQESLKKYNIAQYLSESAMSTTVLIEETPALMNEGVVDGRYRWLYDVPVTISYRDKLRRSSDPDLPQNVGVRIRMQIGRIMDENDPMALRVDTWSFTPITNRR
ncbi:MAG: DotI/IcmL family type IV secretion protein [Pseudomonadota bacterium]